MKFDGVCMTEIQEIQHQNVFKNIMRLKFLNAFQLLQKFRV